MDDGGRYYCVAENKFGRDTVNGLLLVRSMDFTSFLFKLLSLTCFVGRIIKF